MKIDDIETIVTVSGSPDDFIIIYELAVRGLKRAKDTGTDNPSQENRVYDLENIISNFRE